jgi:beta-lactamase superfamily II metal-dependent hydrolase
MRTPAQFSLRELVLAALLFGACLPVESVADIQAPEATGTPEVAAASALPTPSYCAAPDTAGLEVTFFDVGQGDAALLRTSDGRAVLIDGGPSEARLAFWLRAKQVARLDLVVLSHNHLDHIGGLPHAFRRLAVANAMENGLPASTRVYGDVVAAIAASGSRVLTASRRTLTVGNVELAILPPLATAADQNNASIGLIAGHGAFRVLFTGDAEQAALEAWSRAGSLVPVTVTKMGHHGSRNGTSRALVTMTNPRLVVVSLGADNSYGHPHAEALDLWGAKGRRLLRTDEMGTITVRGCVDGTFSVASERGGDQ